MKSKYLFRIVEKRYGAFTQFIPEFFVSGNEPPEGWKPLSPIRNPKKSMNEAKESIKSFKEYHILLEEIIHQVP